MLAACSPKPPGAPSNFSASPDDTPQVVLTWDAVPGASSYQLERRGPGGDFSPLATISTTEYTDSSVEYSTTYSYRLVARNGGGNSPAVSVDVTIPPRPLEPPDTPTDLQATPQTGSGGTVEFRLTWTAPARVTRYTLERRTRDGPYTVLTGNLAANVTSYTDPDLGSGTPYTYRLTARNAAGNSVPAVLEATTQAYSEPGFSQSSTAYSFADDYTSSQSLLGNEDEGLDAEYFDNPDLTGLFFRRIESGINHKFNGQPPLPGMGADTFSIRWVGLLTAPVTATYTFVVLADDGVRLWVNNQLLINRWADQGLTRRTAQIALLQGQSYRIKLEYYNRDPRGAVKLRWSYPGQAEQIVPRSAFRRDVKARIGQFGPKLPWPTVATHAVLLPDGRVMTFHGLDPVGKGQSDNYRDFERHSSTQVFVWTPGTPTHAQSQARFDNNRTDLFCVGYVLAANGKVYMAGGNLGYDYSATGGEEGFAAGHPHTNIFNPTTNTWAAGPNMAQGRWYPSMITLPNEEMLIIGGNADNHNGDGIDNDKNYIADVWNPFSNTLRRLTTASSFGKGIEHFYPWVHVAPNGQVFLSGSYLNWYYLNTSGTGAWGPINVQTYNRYYGSSVMYEPGKILVLGGGWIGFSGPQGGATAQVIELNPTNQNITVRELPEEKRMKHARTHLNATLMPDGRVFVNGGNADGIQFNNATAVYESEIWSPRTEAFKPAAEAQCPRTYHSTALLLLDGTIITMGGGATGEDDDPTRKECDKEMGNSQKVNQLNAEIYYPPYLYNADGSEATRPIIQSAPERVSYGQTFTITTDVPSSVVDRVTVVAFGAVTHAFNMGQRFLELSFSRTGPNTLTVVAPASPNLAPPGYYQLYVLDGRGVPSPARALRIRATGLP